MATSKLAHVVEIEYESTTYTLEYTRKTVMKLEQSGFDITKAESEPVSTMYALFRGAFLAHHPDVSVKTVDNIFDELSNGTEFLNELVAMYTSTFESLLRNDGEGKAVWKVVS